MTLTRPRRARPPPAGEHIRAAASLLVDSRCMLGEGILWCDRRQVAWWTDIQSSRLWRYQPEVQETRSWSLPDRLGCMALCESGRLLLGLTRGLYLLDVDDIEASEALDPHRLVEVPVAASTVRVNDGRADRSGNFVFGTMNEGPHVPRFGRFYQYSRRHGLRALPLEPVAIANSVCFGLEGDVLYYCDSSRRRIMRCAYDAKTATVGSAEVFARIEHPAEPDGAAIDRDGRLWSARWAAGQVVCHGQDGSIECVVEVPTRNPTCLAFGGAALDQILITTARQGLDELQLRQQPHAGGVHVASIVDAQGLPESRFDDR
ncbi:MAG: SMP-30/gluconolactonase/LRE family protein [Lysobacteraceae bacterium]|nr:MAG: SMP-30/gluconolactonase/LRE family protein [Xanthomonadaceae bacterium]